MQTNGSELLLRNARFFIKNVERVSQKSCRATLDKGIDWDKVFIGREALLEIKKTGAKREMFGITVDEADVFISAKSLGGPGSPVFYQGEEIGRVSKFTYSYMLEKNIGYVLVEKGKVNPGDVVKIKDYDAVITEKTFLK